MKDKAVMTDLREIWQRAGTMLFLLSIRVTVVSSTTTLPQCERAPAHAQPADAYYRLGVAGEPDLFLPGELYTVTLQGVDSGLGPTPFTGFTIWAEINYDFTNKGKADDPDIRFTNQSIGVFQSYDAQTKVHESCAPAVDNATGHPKTEVQVIWSAPSIILDTCVRLCARVGPTVGANTESLLSRKMCPTTASPASSVRQPPIVEPCCACDEAKYEVTFEGLWTRNTHPREFPPESARAHFGDLIGASHTAQYRVWQEGRVASTGVRRLADDGSTTALEKELKAESDHIRTIIKARGISWQQVAGASNPSTFAVFRVDAKHHLVSLAAKLAPSPDWIVGVSALELCNANCTWRGSAMFPLYPYDAGTDSGISYTSRRMPTIPAVPVRALRTDWPRDVRSPFFSSTGEMRPFAQLRLTRLRLYEKSCDAVESIGDQVKETSGVGAACVTHSWGPWGPCSVTCGPGNAIRQRQYVWPAKAYSDACRTALTDYKRCYGVIRHCRVPSEYEPDPADTSGPCAVSPWSSWSPCEGCGVRARTRHYLVSRAQKRCHVGYRAYTIMSQAMPCEAGPCEKPTGPHANSTNFDWFYVDTPRGKCPVSAWGGWSPCSAQCGRGRRLRTRLYVANDRRVQQHLTRRLLARWNRRYAALQMLNLPPENLTTDNPAVESLVQEHLDRCQFTLTQQEALCDGEGFNCLNTTLFLDMCKLPMSIGHCRGYEERWFFDTRNSCEPFGFSGCGGNDNNFRSRDECMRACSTNHTHGKDLRGMGLPITVRAQKSASYNPPNLATTVPNELIVKKVKPTPSLDDNEVMQNDAATSIESVDCETGSWLGWSNCFGDCNYAVKLNYRLVMRSTTGSGKPCRNLMKSRNCKTVECQKTFFTATTDSTLISYNTTTQMNYDE